MARWASRKFPHFISQEDKAALCPPSRSLLPAGSHFFCMKKAGSISLSLSLFLVQSKDETLNLFLSLLQVLSALDILQPPHLDFFQEMYPFLNACTRGYVEDKSQHRDFQTGEFSYRRPRYSLSLFFFFNPL